MTRYRPIPSAHGEYVAGDDGSIWRRSCYRGGRWVLPRRLEPRERLRPGRDSERGRERPSVKLTVNGVTAYRYVHRLVAEAWLTGWHPLYEVHHVNGDPGDNRPGNLRLVNRAEHERLHGRDVPEYDVVNCQVDLEMRMAHYDGGDPFSDARRIEAKRSAAARRAIRGSASRRNVAQMIQRARSLQREIEAVRGSLVRKRARRPARSYGEGGAI